MVVMFTAWALPIEEVIVQAPDGPSPASTPASLTVIEIDESLPASADTAAVVGSASGVAVTRLGGLGDFASVSLRGSTTRAVEVLLDGVPLNPDGAGAIDLSELPLSSFRRVEIWRGNAPVGLGGTAMGGVVNLVSGTEPATAIGVSAGSFDTARVTALVSRSGERVDGWLAGQYLSTLGGFRWFDDAGTRFVSNDDVWRQRENNDTRQGTVHARLRGGEAIRWSVMDSVVVREEGIPGFTSAPTAGVRYGAVRNLLVGTLEAGDRVPVRLRAHSRQRVETLRDPLDELAAVDSRVDRTHSGGLDLRVSHARPSWRVDFASGARLDTLDESALDVRSRSVGTVGLGLTTWSWNQKLVVAPVVSATGLASGSDASAGAVLPRIGVLLRPLPGVSVKANAGRYFRPPDLTELYGNRGALVGRADLRPERGTQMDVGIRGEGAWGAIEVGGFLNEATDLITYVQNAQQVAIPTNLAGAQILGFEGALTLNGVPWLDSQTNLTVQRSAQRGGDPAYEGNQVPRLPAFQAFQRTAIVAPFGRVGHRFSFTDGVFTDAVNWTRQAPRPLHTVFVRWTPRGPFSVEADLQNALGIRTQQVRANPLDGNSPRVPTALTDFVGYPLPGRTVLVTVRFEE